MQYVFLSATEEDRVMWRTESTSRQSNPTLYRTDYEWTCPACQKREKFDPLKEAASLVRRPDADLDLSTETRHRLWNEPKTLAETNARLSSHLGESDKDVLCPNHLIPMKLFPSLTASKGLVLDSYAYACVGMNIDGHRCPHKVPLHCCILFLFSAELDHCGLFRHFIYSLSYLFWFISWILTITFIISLKNVIF